MQLNNDEFENIMANDGYVNYLNDFVGKSIIFLDINGHPLITDEGLYQLCIAIKKMEGYDYRPYMCRKAHKCAWQEIMCGRI